MEKYEEEAKFLAALRQPGAKKPLQEMAKGLFQSKSHPLDYAYGLTIGAGLIRCECGLWGDVDDLTENNIPIPCPHTSKSEGTLAPSCSGQKYTTCPECKKDAIHLATTFVHTFYGDGDDNLGDPSEYADLEPPPGIHPYESPEVCLFAHFCFECGYMEDVGIEFPRDKAVNTSTTDAIPFDRVRTSEPETLFDKGDGTFFGSTIEGRDQSPVRLRSWTPSDGSDTAGTIKIDETD